MITYVCDRCKTEISECHFHMTFSGNVKVDLCKDCETSFREWLSGKMTEEKMLIAAKEISEYCEKRKECNGCPFVHEGTQYISRYCILCDVSTANWKEAIDIKEDNVE